MKIKLIGVTRIAKKHGLFVTSIEKSSNNFLTGQEFDPIERKNGLTYKQMIGEQPLTQEQAKAYPFVINPTSNYRFVNLRVFDDSIAEDNAYLGLISLYDRVAKNEESVIPGRHDFFLYNEEEVAEIKNQKYSKIELAIRLLNEANEDTKRGAAVYFFIMTAEQEFSPNSPVSVMNAKLMEKAVTNPQSIIDVLDEKNASSIAVSKAIAAGVITRNGGDFYDGKRYLAKDFASLVKKYDDDIHFSSLLSEKTKDANTVVSAAKKQDVDLNALKSDIYAAYIKNDEATANSLLTKLSSIKSKAAKQIIEEIKAIIISREKEEAGASTGLSQLDEKTTNTITVRKNSGPSEK